MQVEKLTQKSKKKVRAESCWKEQKLLMMLLTDGSWFLLSSSAESESGEVMTQDTES